ncbi:uncharacterized protein LOC128211960 [Mya arenaria]|uniref:uncharacterized protein LOC128211960 n=1 Tax=Mya arenaria TaxID=6604 RepID=UPI0022E12327|nr:uncharacterized protein LOC128211960 [Mya arenaria]
MKSLLLQIALLLTVTLILMVEGTKRFRSGCCKNLRCWKKQMKCEGFGSSCRCVDDDFVIGISGPRNVIDRKDPAVANELVVEESHPNKKASRIVDATVDDNAEIRRGPFKEKSYRVDDDIFEDKNGPSTVFDTMNNLVTNLRKGTTELPRFFIEKKSGVDINTNEVEKGDATVFELKNVGISDGIVQHKSEPPYKFYKRKDENANEREWANSLVESEVNTKADISKQGSYGEKEFLNDKQRTYENYVVDKDKRVLAILAQVLRRLRGAQKKREGGQVNAASKVNNMQDSTPEGLEHDEIDKRKVNAHFKIAKFSGSATIANNPK